ncbi:hypothetical protein IW262DRAFT_1466036 [Armillaria fumosa]|nr:hypothetical protein IW262DRAFT_1466036 [Armillaria fumosa]
MSYTGLCELSLRIWYRVHSAPDDAHIQGLLNVVTSHSWSLTTVRIEPYLNGLWCLDHPMLDGLALFHSLQSLHVRTDEARTEVKANNVIDRTLECFATLWLISGTCKYTRCLNPLDLTLFEGPLVKSISTF